MTDCFQPWTDNFDACTNATGGVEIPVEPNDDNYGNRTIICKTPGCQKLFTVFRSLIASKCPGALQEVEKYPNGMYTTTFCPNATTTPPPTAPAPVQVASKGRISTTAIIAMGGGIVVMVVLVVVIVLLVRRRRHVEKPTAPDNYVEMSQGATEDDTLTGSDKLYCGLALQTLKIPYNRLQFGEIISQGGFGEVVRGVYNNEIVAIKRLLAVRRKDKEHIHAFFDEIKLTATLEHECIVRFIGFAWNSLPNLCMISEFMHGGDLRTLLVDYAKTDHPHGHGDYKLRVAIQVAHALTYLHALSTPVVHRDLKSRNILLSGEGNAKLIDFGISRERQDHTMTAGVGTSLWMAPEVMLGHRYDEKADIFSFGVVLSELDTHALPYDHARDPMSNRQMANMVLMNQISKGNLQPRFTDDARSEIVALAKDCLRVDPTERPPASEVLFRIHEALSEDVTVTNATRQALRSSLVTVEAQRTYC